MMVPIQKVIVKDRIRKDFGNIQELADDIKENGLINPPVINKNYELLAGERRLRACKSLGWEQIPVNMMDTRDAEHEFNIEISENEFRMGFSKSERVDYMKRLLRIEEAKAHGRKVEHVQNSSQAKSRDKVSERFGISHDTMRKEMQIVENKDLLDPPDFADWDEGKLSTNKAYQKMKAKEAEKEREIKALKDELRREKEKKSEVKTVVKEVVPDDLKNKLNNAEQLSERRYRDMKEAQKRAEEAESKLRAIESAQADINDKAKKEAEYFEVAVYDFIKRCGGYVWLCERINDMPDDVARKFRRALFQIDAMAKTMIEQTGGYMIDE